MKLSMKGNSLKVWGDFYQNIGWVWPASNDRRNVTDNEKPVLEEEK